MTRHLGACVAPGDLKYWLQVFQKTQTVGEIKSCSCFHLGSRSVCASLWLRHDSTTPVERLFCNAPHRRVFWRLWLTGSQRSKQVTLTQTDVQCRYGRRFLKKLASNFTVDNVEVGADFAAASWDLIAESLWSASEIESIEEELSG